MKVLFISASYKPAYVYGGPTRSISLLCHGLAQCGIEVTVLTTTANGARELYVDLGREYDVDGVSVIYHKRWTKDHSQFSPALLSKVWQECRKHDVVHVQSWWNLVSVFATALCLMRGVVPIVSLRGTLSTHTFSHGKITIKKYIHLLLGKRLLKKSTLHVTSIKEQQEILRVVSGAKTVVVPNLIELAKAPVTMRSSQILRFVFLGRIHPVKNIELLIDALTQFSTAPWTLDIIGDGEPEYVQALKRRCPKGSPINWVGPLHGSEKYEALASADILLLMSHTENFANAVVEALFQGTAAILSNNIGISEYVKKKRLGWTIEPTQDALLDILEYIATHKEELHKIRAHAPSQITQDFNPSTLAHQYVATYQRHIS